MLGDTTSEQVLAQGILGEIELKLDESANGTSEIDKPETIGSVRNIKLKEGVVSDNTCAVNPCQNGGICQVRLLIH